MEKLLIREWNINQSAKPDDEIPDSDFITSMIIGEPRADIIVITEFFKVKNWKQFESELESQGYEVIINDEEPRIYQNQVLIAIKKGVKGLNYASIKKINNMNSAQKLLPNFLQVNVEYNKKILSVIGIRIRVLSPKNIDEADLIRKEMSDKGINKYDISDRFREKQIEALIEHLNNEKNVPVHDSPVIIIGDFNPCLSREKYDKNKDKEYIDGQDEWCYWWIKNCLHKEDFYIKTPSEGYSWVGSKYPNKKKRYLNDHIVYKGIKKVDNLNYSWGFLENGYYKKQGITATSPKIDNNGYPDHAILTAEIIID